MVRFYYKEKLIKEINIKIIPRIGESIIINYECFIADTITHDFNKYIIKIDLIK